jgi:hypothetical protein
MCCALVLSATAPLARGQQGGQKWEVLNKNATGSFIVALAQDLQGNIWVGAEDKGVFRFDGKEWTQFNSKNGLGDDNAYAIACDKLGRVWVGTLNKGVSVYNGEKWKNYDVLDGPIGERIFAISTCPTDGDVWMATSAGLTRYSLKGDAWSYYTRADGLPEDQANAIAFDQQGNIYVGTQCHGITMAKAVEDYKKWTVASGPAQLPMTPTGIGLPTSLINGLVVAREGTVYAATNAGLAWSKDKGKTWQYMRGRDYAAKVKGRWGGAAAGWREASKQVMDTLLPEDYVTCIAEDDGGLMWLGFRQLGYVALDPKTNKHLCEGSKKADGLPDDYVFAILPTGDFRPWAATYGGGVGQAKQAMKTAGAKAETRAKVARNVVPLPGVAKTPTLAELHATLGYLAKVSDQQPKQAVVIPLGDDWKTQGTWMDRYGDYTGVLCAMAGGGTDVPCGYFAAYSNWRGWIGQHCRKGDVLRRWVHWISTENPRCLQLPILGGRKQSEWDDHGETYPMAQDGPDVYGTLKVPGGAWVVSLYFMNKDGHDGSNRFRDFMVDLRPTPLTKASFDGLGNTGISAESVFAKASASGQSRVHVFWGGTYKRFFLFLPGQGYDYYTVKVSRNYSFNTILSAIFQDPAGDLCGPLGPFRQPAAPRKTWLPDDLGEPNNDMGAVVVRLLDRLLCLRDSNALWYTRHSRRHLLLVARALLSTEHGGRCLAAQIEKKGHYPRLRLDLAACLNDLQLFDRRDTVWFRDEMFRTYSWLKASKHGYGKWEYDREEYEAWLKEKRSKSAWQERVVEEPLQK